MIALYQILVPYIEGRLKHLRKDESGQTIAEYALLLVLVGIAVALASPSLTSAILGVFSRMSSLLAK